MTLVIDELFENVTVAQKFRINRTMQLAHLRPWIIKWGNPSSGELVLQILQNAEVLKEVRLSSADINAQIPATYFHGQIRFDTEPLQLNHDRKAEYTEYEFRLFMDGYTTDNSNFYGVIRRYEQKFYNTYGDVINGEAPNDMVEPFGFELFEYRY